MTDEVPAASERMLPLTTDEKAAWVKFHNAIESELASGGELYDVRDVVSKSADNAVRLAALFQIFEGGGGAIGAESFEHCKREQTHFVGKRHARQFSTLRDGDALDAAIRDDQLRELSRLMREQSDKLDRVR